VLLVDVARSSEKRRASSVKDDERDDVVIVERGEWIVARVGIN